MLLCGCLMISGCAAKNTTDSENSSSSTTSQAESGSSNDVLHDIASNVSKFMEADGREYGKTYTGKIGETLTNSFFDLTVNEAHRMSTVSGYTPDSEENEFLCVNVTVKNIFDEEIPVGTYDFNIRWALGDDGYDIALSEVGDDFGFDCYPEDTILSKNATVTGNVYFIIPKDCPMLKLEYVEYYDDNFDGNTYHIDLGTPDYMDDPALLSY